MTPWPRLQALTIRASLVLGFGLVLGLWVVTGYSFTRQFSDVQTADTALNDRYLQAQEVLASARDQVLQATVEVRNALLEPDVATMLEYHDRIDAATSATAEALAGYRPVFDTPAERERVARLREEFKSLRVRLLALARPDAARAADVRDLLNRDVATPRDVVVSLIDRAQAANRAEFVQAQQAAAARYAAIQRGASRELGVVLGVSGAIALLAIVYAGRLEGRLRGQRAKEARTAEDLQQLSARLISAQEDERRSIARELHDEIGQALMAIKVELAYTQRAIATTGGPSQLLDEAQTITDGVLRTVRDLSQLLNPPLLDDMGLPAAVDWYVTGFGRRHPIEVELQAEGMTGRLSPEVETAAYRIIQEALNNVAKHAGAQTCCVRLRQDASRLLLTIEDDGRGFDPDALARGGPRRGLGLIGIRERVARLRGVFSLESSPETGTRLQVELPA